MFLNTIRGIAWFCSVLLVIFLLLWLAIVVAKLLLHHGQQASDYLHRIESIKAYFFIVRFTIYICIYCTWGWIVHLFKPDVPEENIIGSRKVIVRFFVVYEVFFGFNVIAFIVH